MYEYGSWRDRPNRHPSAALVSSVESIGTPVACQSLLLGLRFSRWDPLHMNMWLNQQSSENYFALETFYRVQEQRKLQNRSVDV